MNQTETAVLNIINGNIYNAFNGPLPGVIVKAYDKDLRSEQLIGETITDSKGFYTIQYDGSKYALADYKTSDVFLRVFSNTGAVLGESTVNFNVPEEFKLDYKIGNTPYTGFAEFDALVNEITPLLAAQTVKMADLKEDDKFKDISFLAGETDEPREKIAFLPLAFAYSDSTKIPPDIYYGLFRMSFPAELNALLLVKSESLRKGLNAAISENIISSKWTDQLDKIISDLNTLSIDRVVKANDEKGSAFKQVISAAIPDENMQQTFVRVYFENEGSPEIFWSVLSGQNGFTDGNAIVEIQKVLSLNHLTGYEPALTTLLYNESKTDPDLKDLRGFAKFTVDDWASRISKLISEGALKDFPEGIEGSTPEEKTTQYSVTLYNLLQAVYPTSVFFARLNNDSSGVFGSSSADLKTFFTNNSDFDLGTNRINSLFEQSKLDGVSNKEDLKGRLKSINRLYKLSPQYEHVSALLNLNLGSATDVVRKYSEDQFVQKLTSANIMDSDARKIYSNAVELDKKSAALALAYKMRHDIPVYAITGDKGAPSDYVSMFGDTSLCDCPECQSVYSPAAYFTDILNFLKNKNLTAFTKLTERRPDLVHILLNCDNTDIPLPYIDLVNELLESIVVNQTTVAYQTENTAEELAAYPQHELTSAYDTLKVSAAGYQLPFDLSLETSRRLLDKLDLKRLGMLELFFPKSTNTMYTDREIALEVLGLSDGEVNVLNGTISIDGITGNSPIPSVLNESQLSYTGLLQVLESYFVNPLNPDKSRTLQIVSSDPSDPATTDISKLVLSGIDKPVLLKLIRFVRLQKKLNWSVIELDLFLNGFSIATFNLGADQFTGQILIPLANVVRLTERFRIPVQQILALFAPVDTQVYIDHSLENQPLIPSLYDQLFRNKAVSNPPDEGFTPQATGLSGTLTDHLPVLLSAFSVSPDALNQMLAGNGILSPVDNLLSLQNLGQLHSRSSFARLLKLSVADFFDAVTLTGINPLQGTLHTDATLLFVDSLDFIRDSNFKIQELNFLMLNKDADPPFSPSVEFIAGILDPVRTGLKKISNETGSSDLTGDDAIRAVAEALVIDKISSALRIDHGTARTLLDVSVKFTGDPSKSFLRALLDNTFFSSSQPLFSLDEFKNSIPSFPDYFASYQYCFKIAYLVKKLKLTADELQFLTVNAQAMGLDTIIKNITPVPFAAFTNLYDFAFLRSKWKMPSSHLMEVLAIAITNGANAKVSFMTAVSTAFSADPAILSYLLGDPANTADMGYLNFSFPGDFLILRNILQLQSCIDLVRRTGVGTAAFLSAVKTSNSTFFSGLLKSKYTENEWSDVIKPISNQLRTLKRDALKAYLLNDPAMGTFRANSAISDSDSLYTSLLIDTEMDACMLTSRIKQGIGSVQLFVDRCLMNLEEGIAMDTDFATQWNNWRKQYRVWEANREVFLYPENWIDPALRDDKSPFFKELESKLRQNEVTDDMVQDALLDYLEKVDTVANLEMIGIFPDDISAVVHVFGRTRTIPYQYYYRNQKNTVWSPWEKVDVDAEGDHILPVVWNNRLMLFWGIFTEKQESDADNFQVPFSGDTVATPKYFEMKLGWSEYKNGKWTSKKTSKDPLLINHQTIGTRLFTQEQISLSSLISNEKLFIRVIVPLRSDIATNVLDDLSGSFCFDGCNSSPSVILPWTFTDGLSSIFVQKERGYNVKQMFLEEATVDPFSVYDSGLFTPSLSAQVNTSGLFGNTPGKTQLLPNHHEIEVEKPDKFFYNNEHNNFYVTSVASFKPYFPSDVLTGVSGLLISRKEVEPELNVFLEDTRFNPVLDGGTLTASNIFNNGLQNGNLTATPFRTFWGKKYQFQSFYHPYACEFIKTVNSEGIDGLFAEEIQNVPDKDIFTSTDYKPTSSVGLPYPQEKMDFDLTGAYAIYNWELFFHIPLLVATRLSQNQKFEDARKWFHYIFDPTKPASGTNEGVERFWISKPFKKEILDGILSIEQLLDINQNPELQKQLDNWAQNPFNPHAVARLRLSAYMRTTVMKYIDNLIAWGDNLFAKDTLESINEATLLYVLAENILGKKPQLVPPRAVPAEQSFSDIGDMLDSFSNAKVEVQSFISLSGNGHSSDQSVMMPLFSTPDNSQLLSYWDIVDDRLFKIRHCMNIQGIVQQLPLFEPPLNPGLLAKAASLGLDLNSIMNDVTVALPPYRFQFMLQKAYELCNDVRTLGNQLLDVLEKGDAEQLSVIRSAQEVNMTQAIRDIKTGQVDEANENLNSLLAVQATVEQRRDYYASRPYKNAAEDTYFTATNLASDIQQVLALNSTLASFIYLIPETTIGPFSMGVTGGGVSFGNAAMAAIKSAESAAGLLRLYGEMANITGFYDRRKDDWAFQAQNADLELKQMDKQISAAGIRVSIAEMELNNHDLQIANSQAVDDFLHAKFTNSDLYDYMVDQISSVYFQSYQMAYQIAKKAEKCLQQELGVEDTSFIQFGYWDSLKKGLLSAEKLQFDLRRLENAYLEMNQREFEITKNISLATLNANAILDIRHNGICSFQLPELLFEMDFPGHFFRRIKAVSVNIPCIAGPYTSVSSQLTLNKSFVRKSDANGEVSFDFANPDAVYRPGSSAVKAIANSTGQNDAGMFEFNFRDERYLPFEGAGVISDWTLELPAEARQFDYNSISDVIITVRYTSRDASNPAFKTAVNTKIKETIAASVDMLNNHGGLFKLVSLKNDFPDVFYQMKSVAATTAITPLKIDTTFFPFFTGSYSLVFKSCRFYNKDGSQVSFPVTAANAPQETIDSNWKLTVNYNPADVKNLEDLYILINYSLE